MQQTLHAHEVCRLPPDSIGPSADYVETDSLKPLNTTFYCDPVVNISDAPCRHKEAQDWVGQLPDQGAAKIIVKDPLNIVALQIALAAARSAINRGLTVSIVDGDDHPYSHLAYSEDDWRGA